MSRRFGFGLVGCGVIAPRHAAAIGAIPDAVLVACSDVQPERADAFAATHGCRAEPDLERLLARDDVDVVSVLVPSGLHAEIGVRAAGAGKHVLVEKPIDVSLAAADRLIGAARAAGVTLGVISQHRFDPGVVALRDLLQDGALGRVVLGDIRVKWYRSQGYYDSAGWRGTWGLDGGGALINQGVHYVDLLRWCMGPVREVTALCTTLSHEIEVEDVALALLRFSSGAVGSLEVTTAAYPGFRERLEICGTEGTAVVEDGRIVVGELASERGDVGPYGGGKGRDGSEAGGAGVGGASDPQAIGDDAHRAQIADLLAAIRDGRDPLVSGQEARNALELVLAVYQSARLGRSVALPLEAA